MKGKTPSLLAGGIRWVLWPLRLSLAAAVTAYTPLPSR